MTALPKDFSTGCVLCEQSDMPETMIECAVCQRQYHLMCTGQLEKSQEGSFKCIMCAPRINTVPSISSSASTTASAREAKLQLEMQQLAEEKRLEREFIARKYALLRAHAQQLGEKDGGSVHSKRSSRRSADKVRDWMSNHPEVNLSSKSGEGLPTGLTSQEGGPSNPSSVLPPLTTSSELQNPGGASELVANVLVSQPDDGTNQLQISLINPPSSQLDLLPQVTKSTVLPTCQSTPIPRSTFTIPRWSFPTSVGVLNKDPPRSVAQLPYVGLLTAGNQLPVEQRTTSVSASTSGQLNRVETHDQAGSRGDLQTYVTKSPPSTVGQLFDISSYVVGGFNSSVGMSTAAQFRTTEAYSNVPPITHTNQSLTNPPYCRPQVLSVSSYQRPIFSIPTASSAPPVSLVSNTQRSMSYSVSQIPVSVTSVQVTSVPQWPSATNHSSVSVGSGSTSWGHAVYHPPVTSVQVTSVPQWPSATSHSSVSVGSGSTSVYHPPVVSYSFNPGAMPPAAATHPNRGLQGSFQYNPGYNTMYNPEYNTVYNPVAASSFHRSNHPEYQQPVGDNPGFGDQAFNTPTAQQLAARHVVPKDLPPFSGNPGDWPLFWSSYETSTRICGYSESENLMRLQRCLKGEARKAVNCFLLHPSNVPEIVRTLGTLYGRPEAIIGSLLAEVRATQAPRMEKLETVINFGLVVRNLCAHLVATGQELHLANPMLLHELVDKLPANIKLDWALYTQRTERADLRTFSNYMNVIVEAASRVTPITEKHEKPKGKAIINAHSSSESYTGKNQANNIPPTSKADAPTVSGGERPCIVCKVTGHKPKDCASFKSKSLENRWKVAQELHLCRRCLYPHGKWPCKASLCGVDGCQQRHHKLLHPGNPHQERETTESTSAVTGVVTVHQNYHQKVLFRIIPVVLHANGKSVQTFAFLDGGSDSTLVEKALIEQLGVQGPLTPLCMQWTNGVKRSEEHSQRVHFNISGVGHSKQFQLKGVHTVESLDLPRQSLQFEELQIRFPYLRGVPVESYRDAVPGILIGLDNTNLKTSLKLREGKANEPVAAKTRLGWVLFGCSGPREHALPHRVLHLCARTQDDELHELVQQFFTAESDGVSASKLLESTEDQRAREILESTTVRTPSGRFQTGLLWKYDAIELPDSRPMAERRLQCLERRLSKTPELYDKMRQQMADYLEKGYAHLATTRELEESDPKRTWYLPLGVVVNPRKPDKLRVVWDAAAVAHGVSFNSVLLKGPDLLASLPAVLSRYRQKEIAISGDIMEMFHQVQIRPEDRQAQRFLWRDNPAEPVQVFVMDVAIFGSTCSPCSTQFVKNVNADEHAAEFPRAAVAIRKNHYVDDYLDSVDTVDEAVLLAQEVKTVHERGGFLIRHWMSNSSSVLERIGEQNTQAVKSFVMDKGSNLERILGMIWLPQSDMFSYTATFRTDLERLFDRTVTPTKREVLSLVMSVFDPLGLVSSFVIEGKVIVQEIWRTAVGWDEKIPDRILPRWKLWLEVLRSLDQIKIPRCYFPGYSKDAYDSLELHVFVDASESAYAAVAYFRIVDKEEVRCSLVGSKTKVAPLKPLSIPRLELQAATIGTRLMKTIVANHTLPIKRKVMWSDSKTVLAWLRSDQRRYRQFVAFRVTEVLEETAVADWRWVPSKSNVADEATKWGKGPSFFENCRWFKGPEFLYEEESRWPQEDLKPEELTTTEELRIVNVHRQLVGEPIVDFKRFSKWERLLRAVAYVRRFLDNCQRKREGSATELGTLTSEELVRAENTVWKLVQTEAFPDEFTLLKRNQQTPASQQRTVEKSSRIYKLSPFLGVGDVLRKDSRIAEASCVPYDAKFPVIVPKEHYTTYLLVDWYHRKHGHRNNETIVNEIRQRYHVPELRVVVRKTAKRCIWCTVYKAEPQVPKMAPLPPARITPHVRAFTFTGLDYFGPLNVRVGRSTVKRWVALFTCLTVRAVHLEVTASLSADSCKKAIRRFIARRGAPQEIYSDQGTNFQRVASELSEQIRTINDTLAATITNQRTQWKFNPPYAPHMGGAWERLVRSVKIALSWLLMNRHPDDETLTTALAEAESMVNSRPLTYLPLESEEHEALTPNHFLLLSSSGVVQPPVKLRDAEEAVRCSWDSIQEMLDRFWTRWVKEYLPIVSPQSKWFGEVRTVQVGDLVMIINDKERNSWTRGKILKVNPGRDGRVRSVDVQTATGIHQRPVSKLAVLDVAGDSGIAEGTSSNTGGGMSATESSEFSTAHANAPAS